MYFMGLDVGTQGVRCVVADAQGKVWAAKSVGFDSINVSATQGWYEQSPEVWSNACDRAIEGCVKVLNVQGISGDSIKALSIDGTSGTIVPLDHDFSPLTPALMYNDPRAKAQAATVHAAMGEHEKTHGLTFGSSFALPRILWIHDMLPDIYKKTRVFAHQADFIAGRLCGEYCVSDYSNALKTGYDLIQGRWPIEIEQTLGLDIAKLPHVIAPGAPIAFVSQAAADRLGLSTKTMVTGGSTDGYASALAAGTVGVGQWASIIGTTFVLKGVTEKLIIDPAGSCYSHKLPSGAWMLGGASNIGGRCLNECAPNKNFDELNTLSESLVPTGVRCYPLTGRGERFPFVDGDAQAYYIGNVFGGRLYPALMEGVAFAEKFALDRVTKLGATVGSVISTTGGACRSELWLRIRASVLNRQLMIPAIVDAAMGSAMLAASGELGSLEAAAQAMIRYDKTVDPVAQWIDPYQEIYAQFTYDMQRLYNLGD